MSSSRPSRAIHSQVPRATLGPLLCRSRQAVTVISPQIRTSDLDAIGLLVKCLLPALLTAVICSTAGLSVTGGVTEVPLAVKGALARSLGALFLVSAAVSLLTYW